MIKYYAQLKVDEEEHWFVRFPDCPGCTTFGDTPEEAREMAKEALELWLKTHLDEGHAPPRPMEQSGEPIVVSEELAAQVRACWAARDPWVVETNDSMAVVQINDENAARLTELCDLQVEVMQYFGEPPSQFFVRPRDPDLKPLHIEPEEGDTIESLAEFITKTMADMSAEELRARSETEDLLRRVQKLEKEIASIKRKLSMEEKA